MKVSFFVFGKPQPAGSKRSFVPMNKKTGQPFRTKTGRVLVNTVDANENASDWKSDVRLEASRNYTLEPLECALRLTLGFIVLRPKGHFGSGKNQHRLKDSAPHFPTSKPDSTKLCRGVEDACTGIIWKDDSQIVTQVITKRYGTRQGVWIAVEPEFQPEPQEVLNPGSRQPIPPVDGEPELFT